MQWWIVLAALAVSTLGGWGVTAGFLWLGENRARKPMPRVVLLESTAEGPEDAVLRGGLMIGMLERVAVTGGLIAGYPEVVALVVAIKGLGRFSELKKTPAAAERFIVGTFASLLVAFVVAMAALLLAGEPLRAPKT
ncbi:hypothetical protein [Falsarthrobacter nasiphocae]|uniref:Uncharacterized protein n=1 Tax=Falsarthrobacter nasiphocae TaxID=189863 RepID=A0AAE3YDM9_9MICC|nr:hypothetical protein [Falsarthrobacter nasiphocae]MDR6891255.1 hypothetical protein [Falsarthrobacter nasiphocae]